MVLCALIPTLGLLANAKAHVLVLRSSLSPQPRTEILGVFEDAVLFHFLRTRVGVKDLGAWGCHRLGGEFTPGLGVLQVDRQTDRP